jgi:hypothetical protein
MAVLEADGSQRADQTESCRLVQGDRRSVRRIADYRNHLTETARLRLSDEASQQPPAQPFALELLRHINRILDGPAVRRP